MANPGGWNAGYLGGTKTEQQPTTGSSGGWNSGYASTPTPAKKSGGGGVLGSIDIVLGEVDR